MIATLRPARSVDVEGSKRFLISIALGCWACIALAAEAPAVGELPLADFTRHDEFGTIRISPDGKMLALSTGKRGRAALAFVDLRTGKLTGGVRAPDPLEIDGFYWVSPTRVIYTIAEGRPGLNMPGRTGEIFAISIDAAGMSRSTGRDIRARVHRLALQVRVRIDMAQAAAAGIRMESGRNAVPLRSSRS